MNQYPGSMAKVAANFASVLSAREQGLLNQIDSEALESANQALGISLL
jgi:hypothetical protein